MSYATLTANETIKLLRELATNDAFRLEYSESPAAALAALGVPETTVTNLHPMCLAPTTLASKEAFKESYLEATNAEITRSLSMVIPHLRLDSGAQRLPPQAAGLHSLRK